MISGTRYWLLLLFTALVYVIGMFVTLFENDSAQFAVMAMRMVQENDFINLFKGPEEYLDKPHLHYWLAALSFKLFGIHDWAYRIPAILTTFLGAYSCFGLGRLLYNSEVGKVAVLIFLTAQTIVLSNIDVRTDAVLTGFTIFAIWQLAIYIEKGSAKAVILGAFGAGMAFSTKGQIALLVIALPILCHLAYTRKWRSLLNWRVLIGLVVFGLTITPMLYAYYQQFDLHPEKIIRGRDDRSGIFFIFWEQSFERLSGEGVGKNSSDYFFFFHTFLWVFLPWTIIGIAAYWKRINNFFRNRFRRNPSMELLTLGGISLIFVIISFAQFKLPHYLNITIPLFAILASSFLHRLFTKGKLKALRIVLNIQLGILCLVVIAVGVLCLYVFKLQQWSAYLFLISAVLLILYFVIKKEASYKKIIILSVLSSVLLNGVLNAHFYPHLLVYQGGSEMAKIVAENDIPVTRIYKLPTRHTWALDFYNRKPLAIAEESELERKNDIWIYATDGELTKFRKQGMSWDKQYSVDQFRITRLQLKFLNPKSRKNVLNKMHLVHIR